MLVHSTNMTATSPQDAPNNAVDAARDSLYCPQEPQPIPRAAPRGNPPTPKPRSVLPVSQVDHIKKEESSQCQQSPRSKQRLIKVDFSLLQDDEWNSPPAGSSSNYPTQSRSSTQMPAYPTASIYNNENNPNNINTVLRRTTYDLATQCESRRASMRRHTIVGCQSNINETHSMPPSRPDSRQSEVSTSSLKQQNKSQKQSLKQTLIQQQQQSLESQQQSSTSATNTYVINNTTNLPSMESWTKNSFDGLDEKQWTDRISDRLSLTLEEIVHIRSVMTKAELEGLPVGIRVKEDVERRKVCFLCLRTRFSIFGAWGTQCKLCQRTVCSKCNTKMRIPTEHFRNIPVVLLSPSIMNSPVSSNAPSPSHHNTLPSTSSSTLGHSSLTDESFPKSLMERLLRPESDRKTRNTVGSAPSSPKHQRSTTSTPGSNVQNDLNMTKSLVVGSDNSTSGGSTSSNNKENNLSSYINGASSMAAINRNLTNMSRSMEGPKSLPVHSPARPHSNSSTLDRKNRFARAFTLSSSAHLADQKENTIRGEMMAVCNDCRGLVLEIIRSSRQTRSSARNRALKNLTLDLSPVYKRC